MSLTFRATDSTVKRTPIRPPGGGFVLVAEFSRPGACEDLVVLTYDDCTDYIAIDFAPIVSGGPFNGGVKLYFMPTPFDPDTDPVDDAYFVIRYHVIVYLQPC